MGVREGVAAAAIVGDRMRRAFQRSRSAAVHERTFLQETPQGDLVIVTFETLDGGDPWLRLAR